MIAFVRISALLVGMTDALLYSVAGDGELGNVSIWNLDPWWPHGFLYALSAVVAGLLGESAREASSPGTVLMAPAICPGGAVLGGLQTVVGTLFGSPQAMTERPLEAVSRLPFTAVVAGGLLLDAVEGAILASPLAAVLGRPRTAG